MTPIIKKLKKLEIVGQTGRMYEVPREIWDLVPNGYKRMVISE